MVSILCVEVSDKIGDFIEGIGKLDRRDAGMPRSCQRKKRSRSTGAATSSAEDSEHDDGLPEDDHVVTPVPEEDDRAEKASSSDHSSDDFIIPAHTSQNHKQWKTKKSCFEGEDTK